MWQSNEDFQHDTETLLYRQPSHTHNAKEARQKTEPRRLYFLYVIAATILFLTATLLMLLLVFLPSKSHNQTRSCGSSAAEARSLDCKFDIMSFSWLAPSCFDDDLAAEFEHLQTWQWSLSPLTAIKHGGNKDNNTNKNNMTFVDAATVQLGEHESLYVSQEYHIQHCIYMWKKLHRAFLGVRQLDAYIWDFAHTEHCGRMLSEGNESRVATRILRKFPACLSSHLRNAAG
jgi:hypothetical protein